MSFRALCLAASLLCGTFALLPNSAAAQDSCQNVLEAQLVAQFQDALNAKKSEAKPIYGCDDRKNFYDPKLTDHQKKAARATAVLVDRDLLSSADGKTYEIAMPARTTKLCSPQQTVEFGHLVPERFWTEPSPGKCSAFKVGPRLMATAGHCIKNDTDCSQYTFLFGFHMSAEDASPEKNVRSDSLYRCTRIVAGERSSETDWRIVEVDREIDAPQVDIRTGTTAPPLTKGTRLTVVGYPMGLPVKVADGGVVTDIAARYLKANLDTYGGNSGSVVLNSDRLAAGELLAEGILVSGEPDFVRERPCRLSKHCPAQGCQREEVTLASEFARAIGQ